MPTSLRPDDQANRGAVTGAGARDDRVLPETRVASLIVTLILVPAVVILWGLPARTAELWAWWITPDLTPVFMGSAYGAGAYFFARVCGARRWHPASAGVLGAAVFAILMLIVTLVHWDRLNHGDAPPFAAVAFYGWVGVYVIAPALVGVPWLRNRRTDLRARAPGEPLVPLAIRRGARAFAAGASSSRARSC